MKAFSAWILERSRLFRAGMVRCGLRSVRVILLIDKKLEAAFVRMIFFLMFLLLPVGMVIGGAILTFHVLFSLLNSAFSHRQNPSKRERR